MSKQGQGRCRRSSYIFANRVVCVSVCDVLLLNVSKMFLINFIVKIFLSHHKPFRTIFPTVDVRNNYDNK